MLQSISLKSAWTSLVILVSIIPTIILMSWYDYHDFKYRLENVLLQEKHANYQLKESLRAEVKRYITLLQNKSDPIAYTLEHNNNQELITELFDKILRRESSFHSLLLVTKSGRIVAASDQHDGVIYQHDILNSNENSQLLATHWNLDIHQSPDLVIPQHGRNFIGTARLHENHLMFNIAIPVGNIESPSAVLLAEVSIEKLWQTRLENEVSPYVLSYLVDQRGTLLLKLDHQEIKFSDGDLVTHLPIIRTALTEQEWKRDQVYSGLLGESVFGTVTPIPILNWAVISEAPEDIIANPIRSDLQRAALMLVALVAIFIGSGLWLVGRMLRPIEYLSSSMDSYARGESTGQLPTTILREFNRVNSGFNEMVRERSRIEEVLRNSQQRLLMQRNQSPLAIIEWDINHEVTDWNPVAETLFSMSHEEALGKNVNELKLFDLESGAVPEKILMKTSPINEGLYLADKILTRNGKMIFCEWYHTPVVNEKNKIVSFISLIQDVTEKKQALLDLEVAKSSAENANQAKSEFLSRMSHELRTPMNAIIGFGQLLHCDKAMLSDNHNEQVDQILRASEHLLNLVNEVLDIAKVDAGKIEIKAEDISVDEALTNTLLLITPLAHKFDVEVHQQPSNLWINTDIQYLKQVILNLLSNAVKYNVPGGKIDICANQVPGNAIRISIKDSGMGIMAKDQELLFEPFQRLGKTALQTEGTGIGLTITKKLITALGGRIGCESEYGKGSTFWFELAQGTPKIALDDMPTNNTTPLLSNKKNSYDKTILCVEDNPVNQKVMSAMINKVVECNLVMVSTAEEGIEFANAMLPDLIFMDIELPGMSGIEALEILARNSKTADIPVVGLSAHAMHEQIEQAAHTGFAEYLTKPTKMDELKKVIDTFMMPMYEI